MPPSPLPLSRVLTVVTAGIVAVSFAAIFIRWCEAPPLAIAFYRLFFASLLFWLMGGVRSAREFGTFSAADWKWATISGFALALHFATWITSLSFTTVSSSVVLVSTSPVFVALGSILVLRESLRPLQGLGLLVALAGAAIITFDAASSGQNSLWGNALALAGALCGGVYFLIGRMMRKRMATIPYVTLCYSAAAVFLLLIAQLFSAPLRGYSWQTFGLLALLALVPQMIGHTSFNWALKHLSAPAVSVLLLGEPVGASVLAFVFFQEQPSAQTLLGGCCTLAGVALAILSEGKTS